jgi:UDP-N-acetylglucosamine pyrophosphorylase
MYRSIREESLAAEVIKSNLDKLIVVKLNGGLGTSMGN